MNRDRMISEILPMVSSKLNFTNSGALADYRAANCCDTVATIEQVAFCRVEAKARLEFQREGGGYE